MQRDVEKDDVTVHYISGYADLATFISSDADGDTAIFKSFNTLASRDLLYMQSELAELEAKLGDMDREDAKHRLQSASWQTMSTASRDWGALKSATVSSPSPMQAHFKKRMEHIVTIRQKLKEYREALLMESAILGLRRPSRQAHDAFLRQFWNEKDGKRRIPTLDGHSEFIYEDRGRLVALKRVDNEDRLTQLLRKHCARTFKVAGAKTQSTGVEYFSAKRISLAVNLITIVLAAGLLFGAIYTLYYVRRDQVKLGLIAGYTLAFAVSISLISNARRGEIFAACAAYAAVLVVFVSGGLGNNPAPG
ncbi:uncharacterized protein Z520_01966 [Fonsecaea multimorphosa CBS 102226]|uniref:DUF6594 domain-containing protein n=1 Tax=Fonsecaea multimorphosa CBS 102226 TaxID=1442371 RepID=A0A0D2K7A4_9EURO|nr:uncharacterized protein Z520_01966 [Fonsecaea multimorphosa CBS 102226]KIY01828.1 hypothetical protein Z520_01966 [Fonsecaea multimorphosa CBS 102226]OAL30018.1 hypothetical protein AYO22_01924 [Fonsecaea multimorphosa]